MAQIKLPDVCVTPTPPAYFSGDQMGFSGGYHDSRGFLWGCRELLELWLIVRSEDVVVLLCHKTGRD